MSSWGKYCLAARYKNEQIIIGWWIRKGHVWMKKIPMHWWKRMTMWYFWKDPSAPAFWNNKQKCRSAPLSVKLLNSPIQIHTFFQTGIKCSLPIGWRDLVILRIMGNIFFIWTNHESSDMSVQHLDPVEWERPWVTLDSSSQRCSQTCWSYQIIQH